MPTCYKNFRPSKNSGASCFGIFIYMLKDGLVAHILHKLNTALTCFCFSSPTIKLRQQKEEMENVSEKIYSGKFSSSHAH